MYISRIGESSLECKSLNSSNPGILSLRNITARVFSFIYSGINKIKPFMRQFVPLFELRTSQYTQEMARGTAKDVLGQRETEYMFGTPQRYCSRELGEKIGLQIWQKWHMPFGWSEDQTYRIFFSNYYAFSHTHNEEAKDEYFNRIMEISKEIVSLNPQITEIGNYGRNLADIIHGMITQLNFDDIKFFVDMKESGKWAVAKEAKEDPVYNNLYYKIERMLHKMFGPRVGFSYVPSMNTMQRIYKRLLVLDRQKTLKNKIK